MVAPPRSAVSLRRVAISRTLPFAPAAKVVTVGEGQTLLLPSDPVAKYVGVDAGRLFLQYEGMNPSGSFKDNGMSAAFTHAHMIGAKRAACASTGNTSASLALYCAVTRLMKALIFIGSGKISYGKLSQALDYGALRFKSPAISTTPCSACKKSRNSWASTWSTASIHSAWKGRRRSCIACWKGSVGKCPTGSSCPAAILGNSTAFGKAFAELHQIGLIDRIPRLAVINAAGANTLYELYEIAACDGTAARPDMSLVSAHKAEMDAAGRRASTIASAIEINRPVNLTKCLRAIGNVRRSGSRGDRSGNPRREGPSRRRRFRLRTGQCRQRCRGQAIGFAKNHRPR